MTTAAVDVAVIGGGPAGSSAAIVLARGGARVAVIDAPPLASINVGETLPPAARPLMRDLGIWPSQIAGGHRPALANESVWGSDGVERTDFTRDPNGPGWHVDRVLLNASLHDAIRRAGAQLIDDAAVESISRRGTGWQLGVRAAGSPREIQANWLIDGTGRRSVLGQRFRIRRLRDDSLVAIVATLARRDGNAGPDPDCVTFVESAADGWWFTAVAPTGNRVLAYFTDSEEPSARTAATLDGFCALWASAPHLRERVRQSDWFIASAPSVRAAGSTRLAHGGGDGWVAAGDALMAFDPISSQGLLTSCYTGLRAAEAILGGRGAMSDTAERYSEVARGIYASYLTARQTCYLGEQRWRDRPFWRARHRACEPARS